MKKYLPIFRMMIAAVLLETAAVAVYSQPMAPVLIRSSQRSVMRFGVKNTFRGKYLFSKLPMQRLLVTKIYRPPLINPVGVRIIRNPLYPLSVTPVAPRAEIISAPSRARVPFPGRDKIDGVIFDMDGTLLNSLPAWKNSASNFLRSQGIEPPAGLDEEMEKLSLMEGAQIIKERYGFEYSAEEILQMTLAPILQHYVTDIQAKPGALELLKKLHNQGIKISIATASYKEFAEKAFERLGMSPYIDFIVACDEVGVGKQSPAVYDAAAAKMGTGRERTLVVEDALYALQTAKQAGYITAGVAEPFHSDEHAKAVLLTGDYYISSFLDNQVLAK